MKFMYPAFVLLPTCCRRPAKRRGKAAGAPGLPSGDRSAGSVGSPLAPAGLFQQAPRRGPHIDTPSTYNNYGFMKKPRSFISSIFSGRRATKSSLPMFSGPITAFVCLRRNSKPEPIRGDQGSKSVTSTRKALASFCSVFCCGKCSPVSMMAT